MRGGWREVPPPDPPPLAGGVRDVLAQIVRTALQRPPCLVAFSGGRDSSAILALAAHEARKQGLALPIPVTLRYPRHPRTDEDSWQESLVAHLSLKDWQLIEITDELEHGGEIATEVLRRHGEHWPPNAHTLVPLLRAAQGGSLMTGNGGDEMFSHVLWPRPFVLRGRRSLPNLRQLRYIALYFGPELMRREFLFRRRGLNIPWLQPPHEDMIARTYARESADRSWTFATVVDSTLRSRYREVVRCVLGALAADSNTQLVEPLFDPRFVRLVAAEAPRDGYNDRGNALERYFADLLPTATMHRSTKAVFTEVFWGERAADFATGWSGVGFEPGMIRESELRAQWAAKRPHGGAMTAFQTAWHAQYMSASDA